MNTTCEAFKIAVLERHAWVGVIVKNTKGLAMPVDLHTKHCSSLQNINMLFDNFKHTYNSFASLMIVPSEFLRTQAQMFEGLLDTQAIGQHLLDTYFRP
jgi:hypothetical protein